MSNTAVVVGAGIGGLAVARGLLKVGWSVQVLERDLAPSPAGTALGMWPEAMRALDRLGVGPAVRARASLQRSARILRPDGSTMVSLGPDRAAHLISRRGLLHTLADDLPQGTVLTGSPVLHPDELLPVDIIVAADGLHSAIRRSRWAGDPRPLGTVAFRGTVSGAAPAVTETWGAGRLFGITPNSEGTTNWFACVRSSMLNGLDPQAPNLELLRALFRTWHPAVTAVLELLTDDKIDRRPLYDLTALPSYINTNIALIGDAAHAMAPNLGRGACEALIDAAYLVDALTTEPTLDAGLRRYDRIRRPATQRIVRQARLVNRLSTAKRLASVRDRALTVLAAGVDRRQHLDQCSAAKSSSQPPSETAASLRSPSPPPLLQSCKISAPARAAGAGPSE